MKKKGKKKVAAAPLVAKKAAEPKKVVNPLLEKRPRNFGIGKQLDLDIYVCLPLQVHNKCTFNLNKGFNDGFS